MLVWKEVAMARGSDVGAKLREMGKGKGRATKEGTLRSTFCKNTTMHGVSYWVSKGKWKITNSSILCDLISPVITLDFNVWERLVWMILVLTGVTLSVIVVTEEVIDWINPPKSNAHCCLC